MSLLDGLLGQIGGDATVQNLAQKVGLTPEQTESAVAALGEAHSADGNTVETAAANTGLPADKLQEIVGHIGGEGSLGQFASLLQQGGGASGLMGKLSGLFG
jgi:ATP phosphoribosyltransferase regulatory subunit HisZ